MPNLDKIEEMFDEKFDHIVPKVLFEGKGVLEEIKSFIYQLLTEALQEERQRLLEMLPKEKGAGDYNSIIGFNQALKQIKELLTKSEDK